MAEKEKLEKEIKKMIHAVLISSKEGIPVSRLERDYRRFVGRGIELNRLGHSRCTMVQIGLSMGHQKSYFPTSSGMTE